MNRLKWLYLLLLSTQILLASIGFVFSQEPIYADTCAGYITTNCSCTHGACWSVLPHEFKDLGNGMWQYLTTGEIKEQTAWAKDGIFRACAFSPGWGVDISKLGPGNALSCLFPPIPNS